MRGMAIAAGIGVTAFAVLALIFEYGADAYYWVVSWREQRATRSSA